MFPESLWQVDLWKVHLSPQGLLCVHCIQQHQSCFKGFYWAKLILHQERIYNVLLWKQMQLLAYQLRTYSITVLLLNWQLLLFFNITWWFSVVGYNFQQPRVLAWRLYHKGAANNTQDRHPACHAVILKVLFNWNCRTILLLLRR